MPKPKPSEHPDDHLEEIENDEELQELDEELEEETKEIREKEIGELKKSLEAIGKTLSKNLAAIEKLTSTSPLLDAIETAVEDPNEDVAEDDEAEDKEGGLKDLKKSEESVLKQLWEKAGDLAKTRPGKLFLTAFAIGGVAAAEKLIEYIEQLINHKDKLPAKLPGMSDDEKKAFDKAVHKWAELVDEQYWQKLAQYVDKNKCNKPDIVYFMQITVKLFPCKKAFLWDKASDQSKITNELVKKYQDDKDMRGWIEDLATLKYKDKALPRSAVASTARLALTRMIDKKIS